MIKRIQAAILILGTMSLSLAAHAAETVQHYHSATPDFTLNEYSRFGTTIELTIPPDASEPRAAAGSATLLCGANGWEVQPGSSAGNCRDSFDYTYPEVLGDDLNGLLARLRANGYTNYQYTKIDTRGGKDIYRVVYTVPEVPVDLSKVTHTVESQCQGTTIRSLDGYIYDTDGSHTTGQVKKHCVFDDVGADASGLVGLSKTNRDLNDDMFRIRPNTTAYFEYVERGGVADPNRLKWIERDGATPQTLMMPSGPPPGTAGAFSDYDHFIANKPPSISRIEAACYPVMTSLCGNLEPVAKTPPAPGACGAAHGQIFASASEINAIAYGKCYVGTPTSIREEGSGASAKFKWTCQSDPVGEMADTQCEASKAVDGECGNANGRTFTTAGEVIAAGLCKTGTPSVTPTGNGSWYWRCNALSSGGKTASCMASAKVEVSSCDEMANEGTMVLVQDLSGSYYDDLPNLRTNMTALLNDSDFNGWKTGLASFVDSPSCAYCSRSDYEYRKDLDLRDISTSKSEIQSRVNGWSLGNGGDTPESQYLAISRAVDDFRGQSSNPLNIILATDATSHQYSGYSAAQAADKLKSANAYLIVLATNTSWEATASFYSNFIRTYGVSGTVINLASDSSNFRTAVKAGLKNSYCSKPSSRVGCGPLNGISCSSSSLGSSCKTGRDIVPNNEFTYADADGVRSVYQCRDQALFFYREDKP